MGSGRLPGRGEKSPWNEWSQAAGGPVALTEQGPSSMPPTEKYILNGKGAKRWKETLQSGAHVLRSSRPSQGHSTRAVPHVDTQTSKRERRRGAGGKPPMGEDRSQGHSQKHAGTPTWPEVGERSPAPVLGRCRPPGRAEGSRAGRLQTRHPKSAPRCGHLWACVDTCPTRAVAALGLFLAFC